VVVQGVVQGVVVQAAVQKKADHCPFVLWKKHLTLELIPRRRENSAGAEARDVAA
jgi:hypothetical protein